MENVKRNRFVRLIIKARKVDKDEYIKQLEESNCLTDDATITCAAGV